MAGNNNSNQKIFISLLVLIMKTGTCWNDHGNYEFQQVVVNCFHVYELSFCVLIRDIQSFPLQMSVACDTNIVYLFLILSIVEEHGALRWKYQMGWGWDDIINFLYCKLIFHFLNWEWKIQYCNIALSVCLSNKGRLLTSILNSQNFFTSGFHMKLVRNPCNVWLRKYVH